MTGSYLSTKYTNIISNIVSNLVGYQDNGCLLQFTSNLISPIIAKNDHIYLLLFVVTGRSIYCFTVVLIIHFNELIAIYQFIQ